MWKDVFIGRIFPIEVAPWNVEKVEEFFANTNPVLEFDRLFGDGLLGGTLSRRRGN